MTSIERIELTVRMSTGDEYLLVEDQPGPTGGNPRFVGQQLHTGTGILEGRMYAVLVAAHGSQSPLVPPAVMADLTERFGLPTREGVAAAAEDVAVFEEAEARRQAGGKPDVGRMVEFLPTGPTTVGLLKSAGLFEVKLRCVDPDHGIFQYADGRQVPVNTDAVAWRYVS